MLGYVIQVVVVFTAFSRAKNRYLSYKRSVQSAPDGLIVHFFKEQLEDLNLPSTDQKSFKGKFWSYKNV